MPYIEQEIRDKLEAGYTPESAGELNFIIMEKINEYIGDDRLNYTMINEAIGVLECAKLELYRRVAAPYEDKKRYQNGDLSFPEHCRGLSTNENAR